jgi:ABC-type transporter Mla subunit MlaD
VPEINQLFDQAVAGCETLSAVVVRTGEQIDHGRRTVGQAQNAVERLAERVSSRVDEVHAGLEAAQAKIFEQRDQLLALVDQLQNQRDEAMQKVGILVHEVQDGIGDLKQKKQELLDNLAGSTDEAKERVSALAAQVEEFHQHADALHEQAQSAMEAFKSAVGEVREQVAQHREQLGGRLEEYQSALSGHAAGLAAQVGDILSNTQEPFAEFSGVLEGHAQQAMTAVATTFAEQVVGQFGGSLESLLSAFSALEAATGGQSEGLNTALDAIAEPVEEIGNVLKQIEPVVEIIRKFL